MARIPECHPDRKHQGKGLCKNCYGNKWRMDARRSKGIPPRNWHPIKSYVVYLYMDREGIPIYVERGSIDRALSHKYPYRKSYWWRPDLILLTMTCKDEWESIETEGRWGGKYKPVANIEGNREFHDPGTKRES